MNSCPVSQHISNPLNNQEITREGLILRAAAIQQAAMEAKRYSAAVAALTVKAKLTGHWISRSQTVTYSVVAEAARDR